MAKKKYKVDILSPSSIEKLKKDLQDYRNDLQKKCRLLVERLANEGLVVAQAKVNESPLGKNITLRIEVKDIPMGAQSNIIGVGAIKQSAGYPDFNILYAVEFGAGIHYNSTPNPQSGQLGFGVGTFPGQTHAFEDSWWYWDEKDQKWKRTYGVKATMPMYEAMKEVRKKVSKIGREVFK